MANVQTIWQNNVLVRLQEVQERLGYIPEEAINEIARVTGTPPGEVSGVATFYSFLSVKPKGRNVIRICRSEPCRMKDSEAFVAALERELGILPGETTGDGKYSLEFTNCIGACDMAPAMLINFDLYGNLTPERVAEILKSYN